MRDSYVKRAKGRILASLHARRFGVLVSTKNGQFRLELAKALKAKIEGAGLEAAILVSNTFDFDSVSNLMEFDAFVSTACPRLALDDNERLRKPLLNPEELESVLALKAGKK